ncbi:MAG: hypothetical protein Q7J31_13670, partial [Syntrophales bacterium]|nr:hypothetical protein [Syntrophales bacterium]
KKHSVIRWQGKVSRRAWYPKLPYFSGRLGFRETEHTISAAVQSLEAGSDLEWSLLTVTHELLHGHVRNLITVLFQGDLKTEPEKQWMEFYQRYKALVDQKEPAANELV